MNNSDFNAASYLQKKKQNIPDFIVLLFISLILVIDFLPYFKSMEIINPQFLYLSVINLLAGVYFYFNPEIISGNTILTLRRSYTTKSYLIFLFICGLSVINAKNTSLVFTKLTELFIVFCLFINLSILLKDKLNLLYKIVFIVCISAFFQSWLQLNSFVIIAKKASIIELLNNMKGNTGNINILAASLTIKVPFVLLGITYFKNYKKWLLIFTLFSVTAVIFLTGARTALINLFLIFIVYITYILKENSFERAGFTKILFLIIPLLISILFSNIIFEKSKNKERYASLESRIEKINTEDESAKARLTFWGNTIKISKENPILGIGLGNYQVESIPYEKTTANDFNASLHAHNDFLEILAETGIINGVIYLSLFVFVFYTNLRRVLKSKDADARKLAILTLMLVIVYGIDSLFNFPMYRPTMQLFFALLLAFTVVNTSKTNDNELVTKRPVIKIISLILIIVSFITSYSAFLIYRASNLEYLIISDDINNADKGLLNGDEVVNRIPKYPNIFSTSEAFYEYAGIYYIREKNYKKAFNCFSKAGKINPYMGRIEFYKHVISNKNGNNDSAYVYLKKAFYLRPRNLDLYKMSTHMAASRRDTTEILREHLLFSKYRKLPQAWIIAGTELQNSGFSRNNLVKFIDTGIKELPNDSTLIKQRNTFLITNYIIEGQNFVEKLNFNKALETYQKALKIDPENIYVMQNIGIYYYNVGNYQQAIVYFINSLKYPGLNNGKTEFFLSLCYMKKNEKENACIYLKLAIDKNYAGAKEVADVYCKQINK